MTFIRLLRRLLQAFPVKEICLIADNEPSRRGKRTWALADEQQRPHLTFTPSHSSWLKLMEIRFGVPIRKVVRRGIFKSGGHAQ